MLNNEQLLIKIMELLDFDLKNIKLDQTPQKERFYTREESDSKYKENIESIFTVLNLDKQNKVLIDIFMELLFLYHNIYINRLSSFDNIYTKKLNWIVLKRLVIPFLAFKFAKLDSNYDGRIDTNMPGGLFWYLPDISDINNIKMPINYLMEWWLDLFGKRLPSLCDEIDADYNEEDKAFNSINILKPWLNKNIVPKRKSILAYLGADISYTGVFKKINENNIDTEYKRVLEFLKQKKISTEKLKLEIPYNSLVDEIFNEKKEIPHNDKKRFIQYNVPIKTNQLTKYSYSK